MPALLTPRRARAHAFWHRRSLAKLGYRPPRAALGVLTEGSRALLPSASAQDLSLLVYSFAVLGFTPGEAWWAAYWGAAVGGMDGASSQALANSFWALARLRQVCCLGAVRRVCRGACASATLPCSCSTHSTRAHTHTCADPTPHTHACTHNPNHNHTHPHNRTAAAAPVAAVLPGLHGRGPASGHSAGTEQRAVGGGAPAAAGPAGQLAGQRARAHLPGAGVPRNAACVRQTLCTHAHTHGRVHAMAQGGRRTPA